ncbi:hypothetical protein [Anaerobium acetethylicum]|nr:hypothetical protein [Anaerobium acetethylicum]
MDGDNKRLYFQNFSHRPDEEERDEILKILTSARCIIEKPFMGPDCDLYKCKIDGEDFSIIYTIDGDGTFLYADDETTLSKLDEIFNLE